LDKDGHFSVEPAYCVNCGGCVAACADGALKMVARTADDLVIIDEEKIRQKAEAQAKIDKAKAKSKKTFEKGLDVLEHMADADDAKKAKPKKKAEPQLAEAADEATQE
jgi:Fe-S-cluster-containing hydrogenase component 2